MYVNFFYFKRILENREKTLSVGHFIRTKYKEWLVKAKKRYGTATKNDNGQGMEKMKLKSVNNYLDNFGDAILQ